jgi:hypothetical protein
MMADCITCKTRITSNLAGDKWTHLHPDHSDADHHPIPDTNRNKDGSIAKQYRDAHGRAKITTTEGKTRARIAIEALAQQKHDALMAKKERQRADAIKRGQARREAAIERGRRTCVLFRGSVASRGNPC